MNNAIIYDFFFVWKFSNKYPIKAWCHYAM